MRHRPIRLSTRLLLIVLTCLLPVIALGTWVEYSHWAERRAQLGDLALQQAQLLNGDVESIADSARTLLSAAAQLDEVRDITQGCGERLHAIRQSLPMFAFVAVLDTSGNVVCSSEPAMQPATGDPPQWAREAIVATGFVAGRFAAAPGAGVEFLPFALPLAAVDPARSGFLVTGLDLRRLSEHLARLSQTGSPFLAGSVLTIADRDGVILARTAQHAEFVGNRFPPQAMALVTAAQSGVERLKSIDGTYRVVGFIPPARSPYGLMVAIGFYEPAMMADINRTTLHGGLLLAGVAVVAFLLTLFVARRFIGRPTQELMAAAQRWRAGDLSTPMRGDDRCSEFGKIAAAYNDMAVALARREEELREHADELEARVAERTQELLVSNNRLQVEITERRNTEAALVQAQKLQAVGQLAGGITHDFNNLLATVQGNLDLLAQTVPPVEAKQHTWIERATGAVYRGSQLTSRLLAFSRRPRLAVQATDVNKLMADLAPLLRTCTDGQRIRVETELAENLWPAMVEPSQVEAAILNLALNARDAMQEGGVLTITTSNLAHSETMGDCVTITVTDTGIGMPDEVAKRAFDPFFTTKGAFGSGLGLSQVRTTVGEAGGIVRLRTAPGEGTSVTLLLPRAAEMPKVERPQVEQRRALSRAKVLVVDDDPDVLQVSAEMLRQLGYCVATAAGGHEALAALEAQPAMVMLDYAMPEMTGLQVAAAMRARGFTGPIVLATGYADLSEAEQHQLQQLQGLLSKPYSIGELEALLVRFEHAVLQTAN